MAPAILHGMSGFLIQLLPCAFFCLYPFYDSFRYSRKRVIGLLLLVLTVMCAVFTYFYVRLDVMSDPDASSLPLNLIFLLTLGTLLAGYMLCIRAQTVHKLFVFFLLLNYGFLMTESVSFASSFFEPVYMYSTPALLFHLLFNVLVSYPMMLVLRHARRAFRSRIDLDIWRGITLIPGMLVMGLLFFYEIPVSAGVPDGYVLDIFTKAVELLLLALCAIIFRLLETTRLHAGEYAAMKASAENFQLRAQAADRIREAHHEINHHIAALSILLRNQDYDAALRYLDSISQGSAEMTAVSYTPHLLLNSMLAEYRRNAETEGIRMAFSVLVPGPVTLDDADLCQFLSNLLDNALEAVSHLEADRRRLSLTVRQSGNFLYFRCENPCDPAALRSVNGRFATTKPDRDSHGHGISIMTRIADRYHGAFRTEIQNDMFTASANLCMPHSKETEKENVYDRDLR